MNQDHSLIDTPEMYLRTVLELEEEGLVPLRARIAERLGQSVPTSTCSAWNGSSHTWRHAGGST